MGLLGSCSKCGVPRDPGDKTNTFIVRNSLLLWPLLMRNLFLSPGETWGGGCITSVLICIKKKTHQNGFLNTVIFGSNPTGLRSCLKQDFRTQNYHFKISFKLKRFYTTNVKKKRSELYNPPFCLRDLPTRCKLDVETYWVRVTGPPRDFC